MPSLWSLYNRALRKLSGSPASTSRFLDAIAEEALQRAGCPICEIISERELRTLESILWELVNDEEFHSTTVASRGFCFEHTWGLVPAARRVFSNGGIAIIHNRLLHNALMTTDDSDPKSLLTWLHPSQPCPICIQTREVATTFAALFARLVQEEPGHTADWRAVFCRDHVKTVRTRIGVGHRMALDQYIERNAAKEADLHGADRAAVLIGKRPLFLPQESTFCRLCAVRRESLEQHSQLTGNRLSDWIIYEANPAIIDRNGSTREKRNERELDSEYPWTRSLGEVNSQVARGLCLGHIKQVLLSGKLDDERAFIAAVRTQLASLTDDLQQFIDSFDYQFEGRLSDGARQSWRAVLAKFGGEVPGTSLHDVVDTSKERTWSLGALAGRINSVLTRERT